MSTPVTQTLLTTLEAELLLFPIYPVALTAHLWMPYIVEMFLGTATLGAVIPYFAAYATGQLPLNDAYIAHFSDLTTIGPQCFILVITMIMITIEYSILVESHRLYGAKNNLPMAADCVAYMGAVLLPWIALCPLAWQMPFNFYAHRAVSSVGVACCTIWVAVTCWDSWDTLSLVPKTAGGALVVIPLVYAGTISTANINVSASLEWAALFSWVFYISGLHQHAGAYPLQPPPEEARWLHSFKVLEAANPSAASIDSTPTSTPEPSELTGRAQSRSSSVRSPSIQTHSSGDDIESHAQKGADRESPAAQGV
jgi:hypothetical protein